MKKEKEPVKTSFSLSLINTWRGNTQRPTKGERGKRKNGEVRGRKIGLIAMRKEEEGDKAGERVRGKRKKRTNQSLERMNISSFCGNNLLDNQVSLKRKKKKKKKKKKRRKKWLK